MFRLLAGPQATLINPESWCRPQIRENSVSFIDNYRGHETPSKVSKVLSRLNETFAVTCFHSWSFTMTLSNAGSLIHLIFYSINYYNITH